MAIINAFKLFNRLNRINNLKSIIIFNQLKYLTNNHNLKSILLKNNNTNTSKTSILTNSKQFYSNESTTTTNKEFYYISNETLESLTEKFDRLVDEYPNLFTDEYDVTYSNNVLTIKLDAKKGTYVINTQTPNSQIWLSSPKSGPYRYDLIDNKWIYKHTGETLHQLLSKELSDYFKINIDFTKCAYGGSS